MNGCDALSCIGREERLVYLPVYEHLLYHEVLSCGRTGAWRSPHRKTIEKERENIYMKWQTSPSATAPPPLLFQSTHEKQVAFKILELKRGPDAKQFFFP